MENLDEKDKKRIIIRLALCFIALIIVMIIGILL